MWLPDAHLCYFILSAARLCVAVLLHGAATSSAISPQMHQQNPADAPPESRGTIRIRRTPTESCLHLQCEAEALLKLVLHIDTTDNPGFDICPPILVSIGPTVASFQSICRYTFFRFCRKHFEERYGTANTFWIAKMIIHIFNVTLSTFDPMMIMV